MARISKADHARYLAEFRTLCPPGTLISPVVLSVSRSGMSRRMRVLTLAPKATQIESQATFYAGRLGVGTLKDGWQWTIAVGGCGMDMRLAVADNLRWILGGKDSVLIQHEGIRAPNSSKYERPAYVVAINGEFHTTYCKARRTEPGALAAYYWGSL